MLQSSYAYSYTSQICATNSIYMGTMNMLNVIPETEENLYEKICYFRIVLAIKYYVNL